MSPLFVTEYSSETIKSPIFTGLAGGFCCLILSRRIVFDIFSMFGNWPIIDVGRVSTAWLTKFLGVNTDVFASSFIFVMTYFGNHLRHQFLW